MCTPLPASPPPSMNTSLDIATKAADLHKAELEVVGQHIKNVTEALKSLGIILALILGAWANITKADLTDVSAENAKTDVKLGVVADDLKSQYVQTEKIRETVEGTTEAVKTIVGAPVGSAGIHISSKEPAEKGCWTVYGGIVRCKGLKDQVGHAQRKPASVPTAPPAAKRPKSVEDGEKFGF